MSFDRCPTRTITKPPAVSYGSSLKLKGATPIKEAAELGGIPATSATDRFADEGTDSAAAESTKLTP